ncbi:uncharacterized protein [Salminus brasiliensis]|uniref:uncharacterized protein n=1 Tax=Salminus brasiliensis TaxID=930266 RepID=UPI003B837E41
MRDPATAAPRLPLLLLLLLCCFSSFTRGEHDAGPFTSPPSLGPPEASTPTHFFSAEASSPTNSTAHQHMNISAVDSSTTEHSANGTLSQGENNTTDSTEAPASAATVAGTTVDQLAAGNGTSVPGNLTDTQDGSDLSAADNPTLSTMTAPTTTTTTTTTTLPTTQLPKTEPQTSTPAPTTTLQTPSATPSSTTSPQRTTVTHPSATTSSEPTSAQTRRSSSTARTKSTMAPTTTVPQTTEASKTHSSTPVQAKARADTPSELNVGDEDSSASLDPLLAGLVSVFVVTAAIVSLLIFLKFRHRSERPEFRRLQDLPMDDMMEDTPLSMYSY